MAQVIEMERTTNQAVATVFSTQQLGSSQRQALDAMAWDHCPTTAERSWMTPIAEMAYPPFTPAPPQKLTSVILALSAALPKQRTDEMRGETMLAVYQRQLGELTVEEIEQAARKCLDELDWFPTIHQIKDRTTGYDGKRLRTEAQRLHSKIRNAVNRQPRPEEQPVEVVEPLTEAEIAAQEALTAEIMASLKAKATTTRGAWSRTGEI